MRKLLAALVGAAALWCVGVALVLAQQPFFFPIPIAGTSAPGVPPAPDSHAGCTNPSPGTDIGCTLSTNANALIFVWAACGNNVSTTVSSVSDNSGLGIVYTQRASFTNTADHGRGDFWWGYTTTAFSSITVTAHFSGNCQDPNVGVRGIAGVNPATPWDVNASLPAHGTGTTPPAPSVSAVSTTSASTMLIMALGSTGANFFATPPTISGWTSLGIGTGAFGGCCWYASTVYYQLVTTQQVSATYATTYAAAGQDWLMIVDALKQ